MFIQSPMINVVLGLASASVCFALYGVHPNDLWVPAGYGFLLHAITMLVVLW